MRFTRRFLVILMVFIAGAMLSQPVMAGKGNGKEKTSPKQSGKKEKGKGSGNHPVWGQDGKTKPGNGNGNGNGNGSGTGNGGTGDTSGTGSGTTDTPVPSYYSLSISMNGTGAGTVTSFPAGIDCGTAACTADFEEGTQLTLTPLPDGCSTFTGWEGNCTGVEPCILTMDAAKDVTATFAVPDDAVSGLLVDFGGLGAWTWDGTDWVSINPNDPSDMRFIDIDGDGTDEAVIAFAGLGLYYRDNGCWTNIHQNIPGAMVNWKGKLAADYDSLGLWTYDTLNGWVNLNVNDPGMIRTADVDGSGQEKLVVWYPGMGLYTWDGAVWNWINENQPDEMVGWNGRLVSDFGSSLGVWSYDTDSGWTSINVNDPSAMAPGAGGFAFWYGDYGLYRWDGNTWDWINENQPDDLLWWKGGVVGDFGNLGIWRYDGTAWDSLNLNDAGLMTVADADGDGVDDLIASYGLLGLWYSPDGAVWNNINLNPAEAVIRTE